MIFQPWSRVSVNVSRVSDTRTRFSFLNRMLLTLCYMQARWLKLFYYTWLIINIFIWFYKVPSHLICPIHQIYFHLLPFYKSISFIENINKITSITNQTEDTYFFLLFLSFIFFCIIRDAIRPPAKTIIMTIPALIPSITLSLLSIVIFLNLCITFIILSTIKFCVFLTGSYRACI